MQPFRHFWGTLQAGRQAGDLGVTFHLTPMWFTRAHESQPLNIRGTSVKRYYSMWVKVAKLDSIVGRLLSYISLCLRSICEKNSLSLKKNTIWFNFLQIHRKSEPPGLYRSSPNTPFLAQAPSFHGSFPVLCSSRNCGDGHGCWRWPMYHKGHRHLLGCVMVTFALYRQSGCCLATHSGY